jgi:hypothetical protein
VAFFKWYAIRMEPPVLTALRAPSAHQELQEIVEFIPIKPLVAMVSNARESYATQSRFPSADRGCPPSAGGR